MIRIRSNKDNHFNQIICLIFFFLISTNLYAQTHTGRILDNDTQAPLAFVSIVLNEDPKQGTTTDINGYFSFPNPSDIQTLQFSYIGYEAQNWEVTDSTTFPITIFLQKQNLDLETFTVIAGENPAHRIIRQVIANKNQNDPEKMRSFRYKSYNKLLADFFPNATASPSKRNLMTHERLSRLQKEQHLAIMESYTERIFKQPKQSKETILGTRVSGIKEPPFGPIATELQPFSFYQDYIRILDKSFLNPISQGSIRRYAFQLEDTLYSQKDTVYLVAFQPRKRSNFEGLQGVLYINTNGYAVQNVIAEPAKREQGLLEIKIQQQYAFIDQQQWFPVELSYELTIRDYLRTAFDIQMDGRSYIHTIELLPEIDRKEFGLDNVVLEKEAARQDSSFWREKRLQALTKKEERTYEAVDSLGEKYKMDRLIKIADVLGTGTWPIGMVDVDLLQLFRSSLYEGFRMGLHVSTNDKLSPYFSIGGYGAYGFRDKAFKYGGHVRIFPFKDKETILEARYANDIQEPGLPVLMEPPFDVINYFRMERADQRKEWELSLSTRVLKYIQLKGLLNQQELFPKYDYRFQAMVGDTSRISGPFQFTEAALQLRFAYKEQFIRTFGRRISTGTRYPILQVSYTQGLPHLGGEHSYQKINASLDYTLESIYLGTTEIRLEAGWMQYDQALPYSKLFNAPGTFIPRTWGLSNYGFNTMRLYEFTNDQFVNAFLRYDMGFLLKRKKFKPRFILVHNMGWGKLANTNQQVHHDIVLQSMEKGFHESGLMVNDLFRLNYFNLLYFGVGLGVYYRHGAYQLPNQRENFAFGLTTSVSW